jgi:hypothetical protein
VKVVVFGPGRRTGALRGGMVVDLSGAFAKYAAEKLDEPHPMGLAHTRVPADLARFIEDGPRTLENAQKALDYLFGEYLSRDLTLYPGDIISGGTAAGTAADSSPLLEDGTSAPERYLKPGDAVEIRSPAIGSLRASIVGKNPGS